LVRTNSKLKRFARLRIIDVEIATRLPALTNNDEAEPRP
jgi:hypothetical protein